MKSIILALAAASLLAAQPKRIVSTAPSVTEMLYALGLGDRVVGVTTYCHFPPEVMSKPKVGTYLKPNLEHILALRPDLVVIVKNPVNLASRIEGMGMKVLELDHEELSGIYVSLRAIGAATGTAARAEQQVTAMQRNLEAVRRATAAKPRRKMMFIVGRSPGRIEGLVAVGRASYLNELITLAGGENIFANAPAAYPKVSLEEVLARNPDVVIDMGDMGDTLAIPEGHRQAIVRLWNTQRSLAAVQRGRVFAVTSDIFVVPGPRALDAARAFFRMFHGEAAP